MAFDPHRHLAHVACRILSIEVCILRTYLLCGHEGMKAQFCAPKDGSCRFVKMALLSAVKAEG